MSIYTILNSINNNEHYLKRYIKFIQSCITKNQNDNLSYMETHHIAPKAVDLFPQYKNLKKYPWNSVRLTYRQHFIAHWMLWKTYSTRSTAFAFRNMAIGAQSNKYQNRSKSKYYELAKCQTKKIISDVNKNKAMYIDKNGNKIHCNVDDVRVINGELISTTKGRKMPARSEDCRKKLAYHGRNRMWDKFPVRKIILYFLDIRIELDYTKDNFTFIQYLDQGWQTHATPEYKTKIAKLSNIRTNESRKNAGIKISKKLREKKSNNILI